ncbi:MAG: transporter [Candidatus Marinimicrobia bacterium]|nr:transporter [Candidatus Neomarinimicrobiota bacterium]
MSLLLVSLTSQFAFGQGPPINTNTAFVVGLEGAAVRSFGKVVRKSTLFADGKKVSDALNREVTVSALPVMVPYEVIPNKLVVIGAIAFLDKRMKLTRDGTRESRGDAGLGDLKLLAKYQFVQNDTKRSSFRMTYLGGLKLPTGRADTTLPAPLQLGTGSFDFIAGSIATYVRDRWGLNAEAILNKNTKAHDYQFGDILSLNLALGYRFFPRVYEIYPSPYATVYLELLSQISGTNMEQGVELDDTGGRVVLLSPGIQYVLSRTLLVEASLQYPVVQDLNGTQLGTDFSVNVGIRWLIF